MKTHYLKWSTAQRHNRKEVGLENTLPKVVDGSKAQSKGGRVRKHTTYKVEGSKAHSKGGMVRKHNTGEIMAQKRIQKGDRARKHTI